MNYTVLSRKWRPKSFDQVIGQRHVTEILIKSIKTNKISHSYLFSGPRGVGKTTVARILSQDLNQIDNINESLDIIELDGASNRGIDEIRDLRESTRYVASDGKYKIYIIDESHMLTKEAFNALLKTLEEPPSHVVFILATTEPQKIPPTISSRCQKYDFKKISLEDIKNYLQVILKSEGYECDQKALLFISSKADGSLRDALSLVDKIITMSDNAITYELTKDVLGFVDEEEYLDIFKNIENNDVDKCIKSINNIIDSGISVLNFLDGFNSFLRECLYLKISYKEKLTLNREVQEHVNRSSVNKKVIIDILELNIHYINKYKTSLNLLSLENLFLKYFSLQDFIKKEGLKDVNSNKSYDKKEEGLKDVNSDKAYTGKKVSSLIEMYFKLLETIEEKDFKLFCVLEKLSPVQIGDSLLNLKAGYLSKYELNAVNEKIYLIEKRLFEKMNRKIKVDLLVGDDNKQNADNANDSIKQKKEIQKKEDHPLFDIALNDFNGKIIK